MIARRAPGLFPTFAVALIVAASPAVASAQWQDQQPAPDASPQPAAPSPYDPSMQAGGLAPPPPMTSPAPATPPLTGDTANRLDAAKEEDSGRGLEFFWLNVEGGFQHVGLTTFNVDDESLTAGLIASSSSGGVIGAGAGLRLLFLTLGARGRVGFFSDWQLFSLGGELGIHIPLGRFDPHFDFGFGYAGLGSFTSAVSGASDAISINGFYGRVSGGLDVYATSVLSLGLAASWELMGLTRPGVSLDSTTGGAEADLLAADGSSYGSAIAVTAVVGLHF